MESHGPSGWKRLFRERLSSAAGGSVLEGPRLDSFCCPPWPMPVAGWNVVCGAAASGLVPGEEPRRVQEKVSLRGRC